MSQPRTQPLPYDFGLVADLHGTFAMQLTVGWEQLHLHEIEGRFGQLSLFSDPGVQITFPTPVSPLQAGVLINYAHWQLPRMGPLIFSTAAEGALSAVHGQGWELGTSLGADIGLARLRWVSLTLDFHLNVTADPSWQRFDVEPGMAIGLNFACLFERDQVCRPRN